jgi:D-glycero-alpha-D-manno-heptose 1-phosphate guanylyltransferase
VILAGGLGTRLRSVLGDVPKPMAPVQGRPFVEWVVRWLAAQGIRSATIATGFRGETIARHFAAGPVTGLGVDCVQEDRPLGTAGGFLNAARGSGRAPRAWLVINGDTLILTGLRALVAQFQDVKAGAMLLARPVEDAGRYGRLEVAPEGLIRRFSEKSPEEKGPGVINAGVYVLRPDMLDRFPAGMPLSFELDVFPAWLSAGALTGHVADAPFLDIGTEASLALADEFILRHQEQFA